MHVFTHRVAPVLVQVSCFVFPFFPGVLQFLLIRLFAADLVLCFALLGNIYLLFCFHLVQTTFVLVLVTVAT